MGKKSRNAERRGPAEPEWLGLRQVKRQAILLSLLGFGRACWFRSGLGLGPVAQLVRAHA